MELDTVKRICTILGHNLMHMQADSQANKIFQCKISGKKCTKGNSVSWKPGVLLRPKININI